MEKSWLDITPEFIDPQNHTRFITQENTQSIAQQSSRDTMNLKVISLVHTISWLMVVVGLIIGTVTSYKEEVLRSD